MKRTEVHAHVRPFLEHEVESCNVLRIPLESAVLVGTAEGDCDERFIKDDIPKPPGIGVIVLRDVREDTIKLKKDTTNCYWGVGDGLPGAPPTTSLTNVSRELALPALKEFLSGRDVAITAFGARASGKTKLLIGDPIESSTPPSDSILSTFVEALWEAFGGEDTDNPNQIKMSIVELSPDGSTYNLIQCTPCTLQDDIYAGPILGWNPLWDTVVTAHSNLAKLREDGHPRGTTIISLRVERKNSGSKSSYPVLSLVEVDPGVLVTHGNGSEMSNAIHNLALEEDSDTTYPEGIGYVLQGLQGRSWASKIIACVSPSPTALQASIRTVSLTSKLQAEVLPSSSMCSIASTPASLPLETPNREVTGVLAFTPEEVNPQPRTLAPPQPTITTPVLVNSVMNTSTPVGTPMVEETVCTELIGLVKMLKSEVEVLRMELAGERKKHLEATSKEHVWQRERDGLNSKLKEESLKLEIAQGENRGMARELRKREEEKEGLLYEHQGLQRQLEELHGNRRSPGNRRPKVYTTSSSSIYVRQNTTRSNGSTREGSFPSRFGTPKKTRSRTPPTSSGVRTPATARSSSSGVATGRRSSLPAGGTKAIPSSRVPSLVSDTTLTSSSSSLSPRPVVNNISGHKVQKAPKQRPMPNLTRQSRNITMI
eukprot:TRINITY_DN3393_c2_g1_i1.p1 TRINITY_DN3393_c2_g1~~TRINITY_DN3393_c2_g1_i1.p1  ORF type:complete len:672 (+),score=70.41 TRINITY_DN3393_c2_g1_i1:54-2018(+)